MYRLTEKEYEQLMQLFEEKISYAYVSRIMGIPAGLISREHNRWELCKAIYMISHPAGELSISINGKIFITEEGYDYMISLFKQKVPKREISRLMGIPLKRIEEEHERWVLCNAIYDCTHTSKYPEVWNGGKRFGPAL